MPLSMKLWQVKGKDLREVSREEISDGRRLEDWFVNGVGHNHESEWVVVPPEPLVVSSRKTGRKQKSNEAPANSLVLQETRARAEKGDAAAQAAVGFMCEMGIDSPVDWPNAVKWYRKAADQGNVRAQLNLRQISAHGFSSERGAAASADPSDVLARCRKAAEKGNSRAQFNLGQMYEFGNGAPRDSEEAVKWYRKSAEQGSAAAQLQLGFSYCNGHGVLQDTAEAVKWWSQAAEHGDAAAQFQLGLCYCNGQGVPQDYAEAVKWYREAAEQGDPKAQGKLGDAFYIGLGVVSDYAEAAKWYLEAAEHGDAAAQRHLGIMHGLGQGVRKDFVQAYKWYDLAAAQHDNNAIHNRDGISKSMTPVQIAEARQLSQEFVALKRNGDFHGNDLEVPIVPVAPVEKPRLNPPRSAVTGRGRNILGIDALLIGRNVATGRGGSVDLLAIDSQANLVVVVLKRKMAAHELLAQTLDNASWVNTLTREQIGKLASEFAGKPLDQAFSDHFGAPIPGTVNSTHSILILTSNPDDSSDRIVKYLASQHKVPIRVLFIALFKTPAGEFIGRAERKAGRVN
jgi:uncharacterized protein